MLWWHFHPCCFSRYGKRKLLGVRFIGRRPQIFFVYKNLILSSKISFKIIGIDYLQWCSLASPMLHRIVLWVCHPGWRQTFPEVTRARGVCLFVDKLFCPDYSWKHRALQNSNWKTRLFFCIVDFLSSGGRSWTSRFQSRSYVAAFQETFLSKASCH